MRHRPRLTPALSWALLVSALTACGTGAALVAPPPPQTPIAPVQRTEVSASGAVLVNGQPVVVASLNKFVGWAGLGWLRSQPELEQRLREAKAAGFNTVWVRDFPSTWWSTWSTWSTANAYDLQGNQEVFNPDRVARIGRDPAMLLWSLHGEFHGMTSSYSEWTATKNRVKSIDPNHLVGDLVMYQAGYPSDVTNPYTTMDYPMPEFTISEFAPYTQVLHMVNEAHYAQRIRSRGARFVNAASITVVSEFATYINGGRPTVPSREEIFRAFLLLAALNYRAFDVLWGANQVIYSNEAERQRLFQNLEQLRPSIDRAWTDTLAAFRLLTGPLYGVLADPQTFTQITDATPRFQLQFDRYVGVYAARKTVGTATYVIAVNPEEGSLAASIPVSGTTATELVTGQTVSLTAGRISTTLPPRAARVYLVR